jgi:hypothetical protein
MGEKTDHAGADKKKVERWKATFAAR